jgi:CHAD domain-containing protein
VERELTALARCEHAVGVRVAASARIAFGSDQHVLTERGELMAADWTAIRRGLSIRGAAHRPPRGGRKARRHRSILAPPTNAAARATSLARVLVLVGVGVALAKAERERRAQARERRARRASLLVGEPRASGLRRVALGRLDYTIELLESRAGGIDEETVHELRKTLKRLRAIVRLLREELGAKRFAREDEALRACARRLSGARDTEVMVGTLDALLQREPKLAKRGSSKQRSDKRGSDKRGPSKRGGGVRALRAQLIAERDAASASGDPELRRAVVADLRAIRERVAAWELRERPQDPTRLPARGIERLYREGRRRMRAARRRGDFESMHAWRKRVKALRYAAETLDRGEAARETKSGRRLRRVARRADRLGEALGEEHDLALLARVVRERSELFAGRRKQRKRLLKLIARRRKRLRRRALREGERLYRRRPQRFVRRLRKAL